MGKAMRETPEDRFWNKVNKEGHIVRPELGNCWEWQGAKDSIGYGAVRRSGVLWKAHRLSYTMANGAIPKGYKVLHNCDNPCCVNPAHLIADTQAANMADKVNKGRAKGFSGSRLTDDDVKLIRSDQRSITFFAELFKVSRSTISDVRNNKTHR